jgi:hypothetical protein
MNASCPPATYWETVIGSWRGTAEFLYFIAGILLLVGVALAYVTYRSARLSARQRNTLDKISSYRDPPVQQKLHRAIALIRNGALLADEPLSNLSISDQQAIVFLLNEWDELALYIKYGVMDENLLYDNYAPLAIEIWSRLRCVVKAQRAQDPHSWVAFDWLAVRWMIRSGSAQSAKRNQLLREVQSILDRLV